MINLRYGNASLFQSCPSRSQLGGNATSCCALVDNRHQKTACKLDMLVLFSFVCVFVGHCP